MRPMRSLWQRTSAREHGFTLIELTIASAILLVATGAVLSVFATSERSSQFVRRRAEALDEMRLAMNRMSKEIRQAEAIDPGSTASRLQVDTFVQGVATTVVFEAVGEELHRSVLDESGVEVLEDELDSTSIFAYTVAEDTSPVSEARVVTLTLQVRPIQLPDTVLTLTSEIRLRNFKEADS